MISENTLSDELLKKKFMFVIEYNFSEYKSWDLQNNIVAKIKTHITAFGSKESENLDSLYRDYKKCLCSWHFNVFKIAIMFQAFL